MMMMIIRAMWYQTYSIRNGFGKRTKDNNTVTNLRKFVTISKTNACAVSVWIKKRKGNEGMLNNRTQQYSSMLQE